VAIDREDQEIIKDMASLAIGETPPLQQTEFCDELRKSLREAGSRFNGDFQSLALTTVHLRNSRLESAVHFINFNG
jgi:hypothetical protein